MAFTVVLRDAAMQYGINDQSAGLGAGLEAIIGSQASLTASWGSGTLGTGQSGTITIGYSHGFSVVLQCTQLSASITNITQASLKAPGGAELLVYTGSLSVTAGTLQQSLDDSFALASNDSLTGNSGNN